jgi:hypothetical protein
VRQVGYLLELYRDAVTVTRILKKKIIIGDKILIQNQVFLHSPPSTTFTYCDSDAQSDALIYHYPMSSRDECDRSSPWPRLISLVKITVLISNILVQTNFL